ncbi:MAG: hypothetical protein ACHP9T_00355 [Caulobacterales bacterium]|jgi:hypothetical protein
MKTAAILLATLGFAVAGSAMASGKLTDVDYLKANRCRGLAAGLGAGDTASLDSLLKTEGRSRIEMVYARGQQEMERGRRDASHIDSKERLTAELNGPCTAFMAGGGAGRETAASR